MIAPPESRMGILSETELESLLSVSALIQKYNTSIDRESAEEILSARINEKMQAIENNTPTFMDSIGGGIAKNV